MTFNATFFMPCVFDIVSLYSTVIVAHLPQEVSAFYGKNNRPFSFENNDISFFLIYPDG